VPKKQSVLLVGEHGEPGRSKHSSTAPPKAGHSDSGQQSASLRHAPSTVQHRPASHFTSTLPWQHWLTSEHAPVEPRHAWHWPPLQNSASQQGSFAPQARPTARQHWPEDEHPPPQQSIDVGLDVELGGSGMHWLPSAKQLAGWHDPPRHWSPAQHSASAAHLASTGEHAQTLPRHCRRVQQSEELAHEPPSAAHLQRPPAHAAPPQHIAELWHVVPGIEHGWHEPPVHASPSQQSASDWQSRPRAKHDVVQ
jgi:hypothetical protein